MVPCKALLRKIVGVLFFGGSMKIGIIALSKMDTPFLMELIKKYSNDNYSDIIKVLKYRLETLSLHELLKKCNSESNIILKEMLETAIAEKIKNFELIEDYEKYPSAMKLYLENITSLDAICTLMSMKNQEIKDYLETKYITLIEEYMKLFDDELLGDELSDDELFDSLLTEEEDSSPLLELGLSDDEGGKGLSSFITFILPLFSVSFPYFDLAVKVILPNDLSLS